ncbi:MAG TPA: GNAT family N-acetyltransferase, partial [Gemmataceae bacterium]|nr:GNAT family N-acetyltransferase [Gemmataceae bacterium]
DEIELGYGLLTEFWGQGLATELAAASVRAAFDALKVPEIVSFALPTNKASRRVMEKVGFQYEKEVVWADLPHVLYRLRTTAENHGEYHGDARGQ